MKKNSRHEKRIRYMERFKVCHCCCCLSSVDVVVIVVVHTYSRAPTSCLPRTSRSCRLTKKLSFDFSSGLLQHRICQQSVRAICQQCLSKVFIRDGRCVNNDWENQWYNPHFVRKGHVSFSGLASTSMTADAPKSLHSRTLAMETCHPRRSEWWAMTENLGPVFVITKIAPQTNKIDPL